jgi:hypothetical protein
MNRREFIRGATATILGAGVTSEFPETKSVKAAQEIKISTVKYVNLELSLTQELLQEAKFFMDSFIQQNGIVQDAKSEGIRNKITNSQIAKITVRVPEGSVTESTPISRLKDPRIESAIFERQNNTYEIIYRFITNKATSIDVPNSNGKTDQLKLNLQEYRLGYGAIGQASKDKQPDVVIFSHQRNEPKSQFMQEVLNTAYRTIDNSKQLDDPNKTRLRKEILQKSQNLNNYVLPFEDVKKQLKDLLDSLKDSANSDQKKAIDFMIEKVVSLKEKENK